MLTRLEIPFADAAAADLAWSLRPGAVASGAVARLDVPLPRRADRLCLHVLGASHAVEVELDGTALTEIVACGAPDGRPLADAPAVVERPGLRYAFSSTVERPAAAEITRLAERLQDELAGRDDALLARFPGAPEAITGLRARPRGAATGWETWHLYPERREVVRTYTTVLLLPAGTDDDRDDLVVPPALAGHGVGR
ncbi:MAG: DUF2617 family protein [Solirubrobacteraceae bacterium]